MSLINDALKKAKQAQTNAPLREAAPQLRPVSADHHEPGSSIALPALVAVGVGVLIVAGLVWLLIGGRSTLQTAVNATIPVEQKPKAKPVASEVQTAPAPQTKLTSALEQAPAPLPKVSEPVRAPETPTATTPVVSPEQIPSSSVTGPEPPKPAWPKLQGILYSPTRPIAILNGKSVEVGGKSGAFDVVAITPKSVTLTGAGQTNVLSLSE